MGRPSGKLALLYDLERVGALLRDGGEPFHPERDRAAFTLYLRAIGCVKPGSAVSSAAESQQATQPQLPEV